MNDLEIIKQIEKILKVELQLIDKIEYYKKGYSLNQNKQIIGLNITDCEIKDLNRIISPLKELKSLTELNLSGNQISDISTLKDLKSLIELNLNRNEISDVSPLLDLKSLTELNLNRNEISDVSPLIDIKSLTELNLSENKISDISSLKRLFGLKNLSIGSNEVKNIDALLDLKEIKTLCLSWNPIIDISPLKKLHNLEKLFIGRFIYYNLGHGWSYRHSNEKSNQITDYSVLKELKKLITLDLSNNGLIDCSIISELKEIVELFLTNNQISDISPLKDLKSLARLDLRFNPIEVLPEWITDFNSEIRWNNEILNNGYITFFDNPIKTPPVEIVKQGKEAVRNYFSQLEKEKEKKQKPKYLFEAKLLIIGEGGVGKTSFATKLQDENAKLPEDKDTTYGIKVINWNFPIKFKLPKETIQTNMYVNLWDFGGQKLYRGTHQIFFSEKSLYVLIGENREEKTDYSFWLNTVEQLGGSQSSLLIFINEKFDRAQYEFDETGYRSHFGNIIKQVMSVNLSTDIPQILKMQECVKHWLNQLPLIGNPLPAAWVDIREELSKETVNYISFDRFREICKKYDITEPGMINTLSGYYSIIGAFTHYINNPVLQDRIYLNSNWLLNTVYKVLDEQKIKNKKGRINKQEIQEIWEGICEDFEFNKLTELMHKFGLMYHIKDTDNYVVPEHLPTIMPYTEWKYAKEDDILQFVFEFDKYKPSGIMSNLIVALNTHIKDHSLVWHRGLNIEYNGTYAEIIETYGSYNFNIRVFGDDKKSLLTTIINCFEEILRPFTNLQYEKLVPCNCDDCKTRKSPHFFKYTELLRRIKKGKRTIECGLDPYNEPNVDELLYGIGISDIIFTDYDNKKIGRNKKGGGIYIEQQNVFQGNVGKVIIQKDILKIRYENNPNYTQEQFEKLKQELSELTDDKFKEVLQEVSKISNLKTGEEKEAAGKNLLSRLKGFGLHIVEHMTAIGAVEALVYLYQYVNKLLLS